MQTPSLFYRLGKFGPFGFVVEGKKKSFILFCCLLGNIWKKLKGWMTKGVHSAWWPICWGLPTLGGVLARECHRAGRGSAPKAQFWFWWGPHQTWRLRFFFFFCDAGCQAKTVSQLGLSLKLKGDKEPLECAVVKRSLTTVIDLWKMAASEYGLGCLGHVKQQARSSEAPHSRYKHTCHCQPSSSRVFLQSSMGPFKGPLIQLIYHTELWRWPDLT